MKHPILELLETSVIDTIEINENDWDVLIADYKSSMRVPTSLGTTSNEKRSEERYACPQMIVGIKLDDAKNADDILLAKCKDISPGGMGISHNREVSEGNWCELLLLNRFGDTVRKTGIIKNCKQQTNGAYKIGIQFNELMNPFEFIDMG